MAINAWKAGENKCFVLEIRNIPFLLSCFYEQSICTFARFDKN